MALEPIAPITLEDGSKLKYAFRPQADMTALESALLCQLFVKMVLNRSGDLPDWPRYVSEHHLWRHFTTPLDAQPRDEEGPPMVVIEHVDSEQRRRRVLITSDMPVPEGWSLVETLGAGEVR